MTSRCSSIHAWVASPPPPTTSTRRKCPATTRFGRWCGTTGAGPPGSPFQFTRSESVRPTHEGEEIMIGQLKDLLVHTGASWVIWLLGALSVASIGVMIDRARVFWRQRGDFGALFRDLHALLAKGDLHAVQARLDRSPTVESAVVSAGLSQWNQGPSAAEEAMAAAQGLQRARMQRRLLFLGTVGNNAPFVGLLGTVIGVLGAFEELGRGNVAGAAQLA